MSFKQLVAWRNDLKHDPISASRKEEVKCGPISSMLIKLFGLLVVSATRDRITKQFSRKPFTSSHIGLEAPTAIGGVAQRAMIPELFEYDHRSSEAYLVNEGTTNYCTLWFRWRRGRGSSVLMFQHIGKDVKESKPIEIASDVRFAQSPYVSVDGSGCKLISFMGYLPNDEERIRKIIMAMPQDEWEYADHWLEQKIPYFYIAKLSSDNEVLVRPRLVNQSEDALDTLDCIKSGSAEQTAKVFEELAALEGDDLSKIEAFKDRDWVCYTLRFRADNRSFDPVRFAGDIAGNMYILRTDPDPNLDYGLYTDFITGSPLLLMKTNLAKGYLSERVVFPHVKRPYHSELYFDDDQNLHLMVWSENQFFHRILDQNDEILEDEKIVFKMDSNEFIGAAIGPDTKGNVNAILAGEKRNSLYFADRVKHQATLFPLRVKAKYCRDEYAILGKNLQIIRLRYDKRGEIKLSVK